MAIREYLFGEQRGKNGRILPFTRFDTVLSAGLAFALMIAMAYGMEPQTALMRRRLIVILCVIGAVGIIAQHRRIVFGTGFGIVALRFLIAMLAGDHLLAYAGGFLIFSAVAWFLLKEIG